VAENGEGIQREAGERHHSESQERRTNEAVRSAGRLGAHVGPWECQVFPT